MSDGSFSINTSWKKKKKTACRESGMPQGSAQTLLQPFFRCCSSLLFLPMNHLFKKWAFHSSTSSPSTAVTFWSFRVPWLRPPGTSACPWTRARPREGSKGAPGSPQGCVLYETGARWRLDIDPVSGPILSDGLWGVWVGGVGSWHRQIRRHCEKCSEIQRIQS